MMTETASRPKEYLSEYGPVALLTVSLLAASAYLHIYAFWSPMVLSQEIWQKKIDLHLSWHPFAIRYFQNYTTLFLHNWIGLPLRESFFTIQFSLASILALVFYRYLRQMNFDRLWSNLGVALLLTAYPMLGAHFAPTHTWDDFWSYLFLTISLLSLLKGRWIWTALFFTLGCFAREQILLFYPILLYYAWQQRRQANVTLLSASLLMPLMIYCVFRILVWEDIDPTRWQYASFNFGDEKHTTDTVVSTILAYGFMWLTALVGFIQVWHSKNRWLPELVRFGALSVLPLTVAAAICLGLARETRLFFPAFVIVIPLSLTALRSAMCYVDKNWGAFTWILAPVILSTLAVLGVQLSEVLFADFDYAANSDLRRPLAGIQLGLMTFILLGYGAAGAGRVWKRFRRTGFAPADIEPRHHSGRYRT